MQYVSSIFNFQEHVLFLFWMLAGVSALQTGFSGEEKSEWIYSKGKLSNLHLDTHPGAEIVINNMQVILLSRHSAKP